MAQQIIAQIYEALDDDEALAALPSALAGTVGARSATIQLWSPTLQLEEQYVTDYFTPEMDDFYLEHELWNEDEWAKVLFGDGGSRLGRALRTTDYMPNREFAQTRFYNDFFRQFGDDTAQCLGFGEVRPDGGTVVVGLHQALRADEYDDAQVALADDLRPHLARMFMLRRRLHRRTIADECASTGLDARAEPTFHVDAHRRLLHLNAAARRLLDTERPAAIRLATLTFRDPATDHRFAEALARATRHHCPRGDSFEISDDDGTRWRAHLSPRRIAGRWVAMLLLESPELPRGLEQRLPSLYGLTQAETRIARLVAQGLQAREIGDRLAVSTATVRTHLQHIFHKMGISKATQLASLLASLPARSDGLH